MRIQIKNYIHTYIKTPHELLSIVSGLYPSKRKLQANSIKQAKGEIQTDSNNTQNSVVYAWYISYHHVRPTCFLNNSFSFNRFAKTCFDFLVRLARVGAP